MTKSTKALLWTALIIGAALLAEGQGLSDAASFGVLMGLTGAALGSIGRARHEEDCRRRCCSL